MQSRFALAFAALLLAPAAQADLTLRYKVSVQMADGLPQSLAEVVKKQTAASPAVSAIRIRGDQVVSQMGALTGIVDYAKKEVTFIHPGSRQYCTLTVAELPRQLESLLTREARQAMQAIKFDVEASRPGRSIIIHGIPGEESVVSVTLEQPGPENMPMQTRMEVHYWAATAEALERFPALKQWDSGKWMSLAGFSPGEMMSSFAGQGPSGEKMRAAMQDMMRTQGGVNLKTETAVFLPFLAQMMQAQGINPGDKPLVTNVTELESFDTDPVPASAFEIPAGYTAAPFAEIMREMNPGRPTLPPR
jgi:hypothetical protein